MAIPLFSPSVSSGLVRTDPSRGSQEHCLYWDGCEPSDYTVLSYVSIHSTIQLLSRFSQPSLRSSTTPFGTTVWSLMPDPSLTDLPLSRHDRLMCLVRNLGHYRIHTTDVGSSPESPSTDVNFLTPWRFTMWGFDTSITGFEESPHRSRHTDLVRIMTGTRTVAQVHTRIQFG